MVSFIHYYFEVIIYLVELKSIDISIQSWRDFLLHIKECISTIQRR